MWRLSIQNHSKSPITEKRRNKAKYLTWNSIRLKFVKKTSMPNPQSTSLSLLQFTHCKVNDGLTVYFFIDQYLQIKVFSINVDAVEFENLKNI